MEIPDLNLCAWVLIQGLTGPRYRPRCIITKKWRWSIYMRRVVWRTSQHWDHSTRYFLMTESSKVRNTVRGNGIIVSDIPGIVSDGRRDERVEGKIIRQLPIVDTPIDFRMERVKENDYPRRRWSTLVSVVYPTGTFEDSFWFVLLHVWSRR